MRNTKNTADVRYPGVQAKVQEFLRLRGNGHVPTAIVVANVGASRTTVSSVMAVLARTDGTGLSDVSAGLYNYTAALDKGFVERQKLRGIDVPQPGTTTTDPALRVTHPEQPTPVTAAPATAKTRRSPQRDVGLRVLRFLQQNKGDIFSITEVAEAIKGLNSSVSVILRQFDDNPDIPVKRIMPGSLYTIPLSDAEQDELDHNLPEGAQDAYDVADREAQSLVAEQARSAELAEAERQAELAEQQRREEEAAREAAAKSRQDDNMILLEKLYEVEPGKWLARDTEGVHGWLTWTPLS